MSGKVRKEVKRRHGLDIKSKKEIIVLAQQGNSHNKIAAKYQVGRSTITKILANKETIQSSVVGEYNEKRKRIRNSKFDELEKRLLDWCTEMKDDKHVIKPDINALLISEKAMELAIELGHSNFTADNEWLNRFRRKYNLRFRILKRYNLGSNRLSTATNKEEKKPTYAIEHSQEDQNIHPSQLSNFIFSQNYMPYPTPNFVPYLSQDNSFYSMLYNFNFNYPSFNTDINTTPNIEYSIYQYPSVNEQNYTFPSLYFDPNMYPLHLFY